MADTFEEMIGQNNNQTTTIKIPNPLYKQIKEQYDTWNTLNPDGTTIDTQNGFTITTGANAGKCIGWNVYMNNDGDVLIGMDVIRYGDFTISNYNGKTKMSFRIPSIQETDYVEEARKNK
mgnify:CR=1 FL=1